MIRTLNGSRVFSTRSTSADFTCVIEPSKDFLKKTYHNSLIKFHAKIRDIKFLKALEIIKALLNCS